MANEHITGIEQLASKVEAAVGEAESLTAGEVDVRVSEPTVTLAPQLFERNVVHDSFTKYPDITPGDSTNFCTVATFSFGFELAGHSSGVGSVPDWSKFFQASGMQEVSDVDEVALTGAITGGPFLHGETVTGGTSSATGTVVGDVFTGETYMRLSGVSGSFTNGETVTGGTSSASVSLAASSAHTTGAGTSWQPVTDVDSSEIKSLTIGAFMDGRHLLARGCRGSLSLPFNWGDRVVVLATYQGILALDANTANKNASSVAYDSAIPPAFRGANLVIQGGSDSEWTDARLSQISIDLGNTVVVRQNVNDADGYDPALIVGRAPTGSFNPDLVATTTQDVLDHWYAGEVAHARWDLGDTAGNRFQVKCPALQYTSVPFGDRDNVKTMEAAFKLTGGLFSGSGGNQAAHNNEFILHYR